MQHFSQKIAPIANVLVFALLVLFAPQQHTHTKKKKQKRKVKLHTISHRTQTWTGQNDWHLVKIVIIIDFQARDAPVICIQTPVASNSCGKYSNHTCNQLKWRKVDSTFVLCVTLSMDKIKKCKELSVDLRENNCGKTLTISSLQVHLQRY